MKRGLKQIFLFAVLVLILMSAGCDMNPGEPPCNYPLTTWTSDDPQITFTVDENRQCYGEIIYDGQVYPIQVHFGYGADAYFFSVDGKNYVYLSCDCTYSPDKMVVKTSGDDVFGGKYDEIVFVRSEPEPSESDESSVQE